MAWRDWGVVKSISKFFSNSSEPTQIVIESTSKIPEATSSSAKDRKKSLIARLGLAFTKSNSSGGRDVFEEAVGFDFDEIESAYLTDSYVRQACDKYVDYMFKAGYDIVGKDAKAVEYIKLRLESMAIATQKPLGEFFNDIAEDLIKFHNVFIIKARAGNSYQYPAGITATPVLSNKTVAGYFLLPGSSITIAREPSGQVTKYKQKISGKTELEIIPDDMIHITVDKPQGRAFGLPFLQQVLDDVKLLRQMEELTDRMIYKNIFPLMVYTVGTPEDKSTNEEITEVKEQLVELPLDGGVVVPERHKISTVGVGDKMIDVANYLEYFKKRVFTGLGVSPTIMGESDTSNKSTSDNLDQIFKDRVKAYQRIIEQYVNSKIIYELLLEGGYDPLVNVNDVVQFQFREIDLEAKMAEQNHIVQLFTQNAITHEEMRLKLGYDPVQDENRLYFNMVTIPVAVQTAQASSTDTENADTKAANNAGANKNQPANQNGARASAKTTKNSAVHESVTTEKTYSGVQADRLLNSLINSYDSAKTDVIKQVNKHIKSGKSLTEFSKKDIALTCNLLADYMGSISARYTGFAFIEGASDAQSQAGSNRSDINITYNIGLMNQEFKEKTSKLVEDLMDQIELRVRTSSEEDVASKIVGVFSTLQYRLKFISTTQVYGSYNAGFAKTARSLGYTEAYSTSSEAGCDVCGMSSQTPINLLSGAFPPFHPNCSCKLTLRKKEGSE
jgi:hypothetical protein